MRFSLFALLLLISTSVGANRQCARNAETLARQELLNDDFARRSEFGMTRDNARVLPPQRCTPFMQEARFIPLAKRQAAGVNRERFMDADCNVYEWDSQHGNFEKYAAKGNTLRHAGDVSPIHGVEDASKARATRDYVDNNTGYNGMDLNRLCREHQRGRLRPASRGLRCI